MKFLHVNNNIFVKRIFVRLYITYKYQKNYNFNENIKNLLFEKLFVDENNIDFNI